MNLCNHNDKEVTRFEDFATQIIKVEITCNHCFELIGQIKATAEDLTDDPDFINRRLREMLK